MGRCKCNPKSRHERRIQRPFLGIASGPVRFDNGFWVRLENILCCQFSSLPFSLT